MIRWRCDGNRHKKRMRRANWDCCTHQCRVNRNNSSHLGSNSNRRTTYSHQETITQDYHHRIMIMSLANVFISVAASQVSPTQFSTVIFPSELIQILMENFSFKYIEMIILQMFSWFSFERVSTLIFFLCLSKFENTLFYECALNALITS